MHAGQLILEDDELVNRPERIEQRPNVAFVHRTRNLTHEQLDGVRFLVGGILRCRVRARVVVVSGGRRRGRRVSPRGRNGYDRRRGLGEHEDGRSGGVARGAKARRRN